MYTQVSLKETVSLKDDVRGSKYLWRYTGYLQCNIQSCELTVLL